MFRIETLNHEVQYFNALIKEEAIEMAKDVFGISEEGILTIKQLD